MKRIICAAAALLIVAGAFASCGKNGQIKGTSSPAGDGTTAQPDPLAKDYYHNTVTQENGDTTTHRTDFIEQDSHGIEVVMISADVKPGQLCSIRIKGAPESVFKIELYENSVRRLEIEELRKAQSDKDGYASFQFVMPESVKAGAKAVIIRQQGIKTNYVRTAIYVKQ